MTTINAKTPEGVKTYGQSRRRYPQDQRDYKRARYLPEQLEAAYLKVRLLENEARRREMTAIIDPNFTKETQTNDRD